MRVTVGSVRCPTPSTHLRIPRHVRPRRTLPDRPGQFQAAGRAPDNPTLLKIYGLFKQATEGDNTAKKPSFSDIVARAKWDAWTSRKGLSGDEAKEQYIALIESLRG